MLIFFGCGAGAIDTAITGVAPPDGHRTVQIEYDGVVRSYTFVLKRPPGWDWYGEQHAEAPNGFRPAALQPSPQAPAFTGSIGLPTGAIDAFVFNFHGKLIRSTTPGPDGGTMTPLIVPWRIDAYAGLVLKIAPEVLYVPVGRAPEQAATFAVFDQRDRPVLADEWQAPDGVTLSADKGHTTAVTHVEKYGRYVVIATGHGNACGAADVFGVVPTIGIPNADPDDPEAKLAKAAILAIGDQVDLDLSIQPAAELPGGTVTLTVQGTGDVTFLTVDGNEIENPEWGLTDMPARLQARATSSGTATVVLTYTAPDKTVLTDQVKLTIEKHALTSLTMRDPGIAANTRIDATDDVQTPADNMLSVGQKDGKATVELSLTWLGGSKLSNQMKWAFIHSTGSISPWDQTSGDFTDGPVTLTWNALRNRNGPRSFEIVAWWDRNGDNMWTQREPCRNLTINIVDIDIFADVNRNGGFDYSDSGLESKSPGLIVGANVDDDDRDGVVDRDDGFNKNGTLGDADDTNPKDNEARVDIFMLTELGDLADGKVTLEATVGGKCVRIWKNGPRTASNIAMDRQDANPDNDGPIEWVIDHAADKHPTPWSGFGVEGLAACSNWGGVTIKLSCFDSRGTNVCSDSITLTVMELLIAADGNRDGIIDFAAPEDRQMTFWVNDDDDFRHKEEGEMYEDDNVVKENPDCSDEKIDCVRDLEDFARVHIYTKPADINSQGLTLTIGLPPVATFDPCVSLFPASRTDDKFRTVAKVANAQTALKRCLTIWDHAKEVPAEHLSTTSEVKPFLLEGVEPGAGLLTVSCELNGTKLCDASLLLELHPIRWFYDEYTVPEPGRKYRTNVHVSGDYTRRLGGYVPANPDESLLFVHGWNVKSKIKNRWTETIFKRLWWEGYQGRVGGFFWPALEWQGVKVVKLLDIQNYNDSEFRAWLSAPALCKLMESLTPTVDLRVLVHSQGNIVMGEALRLYDGPEIHTYVATQAAISTSFYDPSNSNPFEGTSLDAGLMAELAKRGINTQYVTTPDIYAHFSTGDYRTTPYLAGNYTKVQNLHNYFNRLDFALTNGWEWGNINKPGGVLDDSFDYDGPVETYNERTDHFYKIEKAGKQDRKVKLHVGPERERYMIWSYAAESRSRALGTQGAVGLDSSTDFAPTDLRAEVGYSGDHYGHSRQFRSTIVDEKPYWHRLVQSSRFSPVQKRDPLATGSD